MGKWGGRGDGGGGLAKIWQYVGAGEQVGGAADQLTRGGGAAAVEEGPIGGRRGDLLERERRRRGRDRERGCRRAESGVRLLEWLCWRGVERCGGVLDLEKETTRLDLVGGQGGVRRSRVACAAAWFAACLRGQAGSVAGWGPPQLAHVGAHG